MPEFAPYTVMMCTMALFFYTLGIGAEQFTKGLKPWHSVLIFIGVVAQTLGTGNLIKHSDGSLINTHVMALVASMIFLIIHFMWSVLALSRGDILALQGFRKLSIFVWATWVVIYLVSVLSGV